MAYLHSDREQFRDAIDLAYEQTGVMVQAIEKDYYVTMLLRLLAQKMPYIVFKGGTSLSKCHKVIRRFSEDIDITIDTLLSQGQKKKIKQAIVDSAQELGMTIENLDETRSRRDYNRYVIAYDSVIPMASDALKAAVLLETSYTAVSFPTVLLPVHSYIGDMMEQEAPDAIEEYAKRKNLLMGSNPIIAPDSEMLWNAAIVWRILRRYEYTGALVMGRRKKIDVNTTSVRTLPEDKWIIAENAHAAIVTKDEYYQAQKAIRNVTPIQYKVGDEFALKGKICCGNCNRQLRHEKQYGEMVFYCGYKRSAGKFSKCYGGYYREYSVNAKVARAIKTVFYALDMVNQGMQEKQSITVRCVDIEDLEKQAEAIRVEQIKLYESYADGVLRRDAYIEKKKALSEKLAALQDSIRTEKEEQECADELDEEIRALTKQASEKTYIGGLTKECVDAFVSMVYLYDDQTMKIEFNCEDVIRRALEKYGA